MGTGRGVNTFSDDEFIKEYRVRKTSLPIVECNQNAILNYKNKIVVGTIDGLVQCRTNLIAEKVKHPLIHISSISIFHKKDKHRDKIILWPPENAENLKLTHDQNSISINYKAIFLSSPHSISYRYKLKGLDNDYGKSLKNTQVEYYGLRPGNYSFFVYAIGNGNVSNVSCFNFIIVPPFYEHIWFKIGVFFLSLFIFWLIFYLFFKSKERKKHDLEQIKQIEQNKIRKQTSEDFHDDIGNKLTRINVLTEILGKKLDEGQTEQKELIRLIQENAALLYNGTKDILWALNPKSDNLFEILAHIRNFGVDLFQHTGIKFEMAGVLSTFQSLQLSMEFNRNFTLIFKEILNNILKHAQATEVLILVIKTPQHTIDILTIDNGIGFDLSAVKNGHGLNNIQTRCKRIKASYKINAIEGKGTTSIISTKIIFKNDLDLH